MSMAEVEYTFCAYEQEIILKFNIYDKTYGPFLLLISLPCGDSYTKN
jgi:hypothetical protein